MTQGKCKLTLAIICILISLKTFAQEFSESEITVIEDINYATFGQQKVQLDLYHPLDSGIYPGVVLVHGGGWLYGSRKGFDQMALSLARFGYVVANIDYRLATQATFPGAVQDTKAAVRWLRKHADLYHVNPSKIAGIGGSAGGHLISMAALTGHTTKFNGEGNLPDVSSELQAVIMMGTGVDQVTRAETSKNNYVESAVIFFGGSFADKKKVYAQGSPITHISRHSPPILMLDGSKDNPGARYVDFIPKLKQFSVEHEFKVVSGAKHGQWLNEKYLKTYVNTFDQFLRTHLEPTY